MGNTYVGIWESAKDVKDARGEQSYRLLMYAELLIRQGNKLNINEKKADSGINLQLVTFWKRESALEQKIYGEMKKWEKRHPIMGIVICTILGGILISLIAGIILEAIIMTI